MQIMSCEVQTAVECEPLVADLEGHNFIFQTTDSRGRTHYALIENMPDDERVMSPFEAQQLRRLMADPIAFHAAGYGGKPEGAGTNYREDDIVGDYLQGTRAVPLLEKAGAFILGRAIMAGQQQAMFPHLRGSEIEKKLIYKTAEEAWSYMVQANLRLAASIGTKYPGIPMDEGVQEANFGLMHAVSKFDYRKGFAFSTYATNWIRQALGRAQTKYRDVPASQDTAAKLKQLQADEAAFPEDRTSEGIYNRLGIPAEKVAELQKFDYQTGSLLRLDQPIGEDADLTIGDTVQTTIDPENERVESLDTYAVMTRAIQRLPEPYRQLFTEVTVEGALIGNEDESIIEIRKRHGKSAAQIDRILFVARAMLMHPAMELTPLAGDSEDAQAWEDALCAGGDISLFFPSFENRVNKQVREARELICGNCAVRGACLAFAEQNSDKIRFGYWGAVNIGNRNRKKKAMQPGVQAS
jgi:RNA polymerase sigma factor (sigma-70 family)